MTADDIRPLPLDAVFDLLTHQYRRYVLYCLFRLESPISLPTVADRVTEWETGRRGEDAPEKRLRIYMDLYHDQLPELVRHGVVAYRQADDTVALDDNAARFEPYVERAYVDEIADRVRQEG